jgi:DNA-binding transcriptional ArsR family regulator
MQTVTTTFHADGELAKIFNTLDQILAFKRSRFPFMKDKLDHDLCLLIGKAEIEGRCANLTYITTAELGTFSTVTRHLRRLENLGVLRKQRLPDDKRNVRYRLAPHVLQGYREYLDIWQGALAP